MPTRSERGSVSVLMTAVVCILLFVALGVIRLGGAALSAERARATADLAALAAATGGAEAGRSVGAANGATSVEVSRRGPTTVVRLERAGAVAGAAAEPRWEPR